MHYNFSKIKMRSFALVIGLICIMGCVSPVALNTMGTVGSNAPVAFNKLSRGQIESFWIANYDDVIAATLRAGEALSLSLKEKKVENDLAFYRFYDAKKERIDLSIERRSDTMTSVRFNVGWYGNVALSRLMAKQIISELNQSGSFPEDWKYKMSD